MIGEILESFVKQSSKHIKGFSLAVAANGRLLLFKLLMFLPSLKKYSTRSILAKERKGQC
jgi:hypothetical protein